jgi:hypothetical protein
VDAEANDVGRIKGEGRKRRLAAKKQGKAKKRRCNLVQKR